MAIIGREDLARDVAARVGTEVGHAKLAVEAIASHLADGDEVRLTRFGKFSASERAAREGRNPQTGETMQIPARRMPKFTAAADLKKAVQ